MNKKPLILKGKIAEAVAALPKAKRQAMETFIRENIDEETLRDASEAVLLAKMIEQLPPKQREIIDLFIMSLPPKNKQSPAPLE